MKQRLAAILVIVFIIGGLVVAMKVRTPKPPPPTTGEIWKESGVPVEVAATIRGNMDQLVEVTGDISALDKVTLSSKVAGRVAQVMMREGDPVKQGQTIIMLDQEDALSGLKEAQGALRAAEARVSQAKTQATVTRIETQLAIEQAQSNLSAAEARLAVVKKPTRTQDRIVAENKVDSKKADLDNAAANYKRNKKLLDQGAISASTFDVAEAQYKVAQAEYNSAVQQLSLIKEGGRSEDISAAQSQVEVAKQQLRAAKANAAQNMLRQEDIKSAQAALVQAKSAVELAQQRLSYTYIKSPISGQLSSRATEPGQVVSPGQALGEVVSLNSLYFKGDVSEKELPNVSRGQRVQVRIDAIPHQIYDGLVAELYPAASSVSRNFPVRIKILDQSGTIRPGMFARGNIVAGVDAGVMLVPKDAVLERRGTKIVYTIEGKDKAKRHNVEVLRENRDYVELKAPTTLQVGDTVVVSGQQNLQDGVKVSVRNQNRTAELP